MNRTMTFETQRICCMQTSVKTISFVFRIDVLGENVLAPIIYSQLLCLVLDLKILV